MANLGFIEGWNARVKLQTQSTDPPNILTTKKYVDDIKATFDTFLAAIPTANIVTTASARFVTDAEKTAWNGKASTALATTSINGLMSSTDKTKLDRVPTLSAANAFSVGFSVAGNINVTGEIVASGNITAYSDKRLKSEVKQIQDALIKVKKLSGYTYLMNGFEDRQTGVIAQEVQEVLPEAVKINEEGLMSVAYGNMIGLLIESIKELDEKVESLKELL